MQTTQWEPKQWLLEHVWCPLKKRFEQRLVENYPARGTATRNHKHGREPFSNLEKRRHVSGGAYHLKMARWGNQESWDALVEIVAGNVQNIAVMNKWQVDAGGERALGIARALVAKELGKIDTDTDMAIVAGISRKSWYKTWRGRIDDLHRQTIQPLAAEIL